MTDKTTWQGLKSWSMTYPEISSCGRSSEAFWRRMVLSAHGLGKKALSRCCVAFSRQKEVDRRTGGVDSPDKYTHLPLTRM